MITSPATVIKVSSAPIMALANADNASVTLVGPDRLVTADLPTTPVSHRELRMAYSAQVT